MPQLDEPKSIQLYMSPLKAIGILSAWFATHDKRFDPDFYNALQLAIHALQGVQAGRKPQ